MAQPIYFEPFFFRQELLQKQHEEKMRGLATIPLAIRDLSQTMFEYANMKRQDAKDKVDALSSVIHQWGSKAGQPAMNAYGNALDTLMGNKVVPRDEYGDVTKIPQTFAEKEQAHLDSLPLEDKAKLFEMKAGLRPDANHELMAAAKEKMHAEDMEYKRSAIAIKGYQASEGNTKRALDNEPSMWKQDPDTGKLVPTAPGDPEALTNVRAERWLKQNKMNADVIVASNRADKAVKARAESGDSTDEQKHLSSMIKQLNDLSKMPGVDPRSVDALKSSVSEEVMRVYGKGMPQLDPKDKKGIVDQIWSKLTNDVDRKLPTDPDKVRATFESYINKGWKPEDVASTLIASGYDENIVRDTLRIASDTSPRAGASRKVLGSSNRSGDIQRALAGGADPGAIDEALRQGGQ